MKWHKAKPPKENKLQDLVDKLEQVKKVVEEQKALYEDDLAFLEKVASTLKDRSEDA